MFVTLKQSAIGTYKAVDIIEQLNAIDLGDLESSSFIMRADGPPQGKSFEVNLVSKNDDQLYMAVDYLKDQISQIDGVIDVEDDIGNKKKELRVDLDYEKLNYFGLTIARIGPYLRSGFSGTTVGKMFLNSKEVDVIVKYDNDSNNKNNILETSVPNPRVKIHNYLHLQQSITKSLLIVLNDTMVK